MEATCHGSRAEVPALEGGGWRGRGEREDKGAPPCWSSIKLHSLSIQNVVLGLVVSGSSESMLDMQNLSSHPDFLSQNLHLNKLLGNTGHSKFQDVLLFRKTKLHHNRSQQNKQKTKKNTQQSKIRKTQGERQWGPTTKSNIWSWSWWVHLRPMAWL